MEYISSLFEENTEKDGYHLPAIFLEWCIDIYEKIELILALFSFSTFKLKFFVC